MILGLVAFLALGASADPALLHREFQAIANAHRDLTRYDVMIEVRYEGAMAVPSTHAEVRCIERTRCLRSIGQLSLLDSPQCSLAIDAASKTMTVAYRTASEQAPTASGEDPSHAFDKWLQTGAKILEARPTSAGRHFTYQAAGSDHISAEFYTEPATHLLRKVIYETHGADGQPARVSVEYTWKDASHLRDEEFSETHYLLKHADRIEATTHYADYRIVRADRH
jgi:hypothetical protein